MFYEENGTTKVNDSYRTDDNFSLGTWIKTQRQNYKIGTINNDQKSLLSSLGDWSWDPNNEAWNLNYNVVLAYYNEYKNLDFNHSTVYKDFAIGSWSNKQRQKYKNKILDASKIALLEELPEWRWSFKDEAWEDGIEQLQLYIKEHGNPMVHRSYVSPDGFKLGTWVTYQRRSKTINLLSQDRIDRLEALISWTWGPLTDKWQEGLEQLQLYIKEHGNPIVHRSYVSPDGFKLGDWVSRNKSNNLLIQDRIDRLEALSGWVWTMKKE